MPNTDVDERKNNIRRHVWDLLDRQHAVLGGSAHGRIPHFVGADRAADLLTTLPAWHHAHTIKAVPDKAQLPARALALRDGKTVYMAVPKLAQPQPFYLLDPTQLTLPAHEAASSHTAATHAPAIGLDELNPVDLIICGSVAVNHNGTRLGKGAGYSDIEVALLAQTGLISPHTTIATTVHPLQILDTEIPESPHDFSVDLIITPDDVITCPPPRRPAGLNWNTLTDDQVAAMPILQALRETTAR